MPFIRDTSSRSSSSSDGQRRSLAGPNQIVDDDEYPAVSFPGYAEKPLSEQLEPIAVVGMGQSPRRPDDLISALKRIIRLPAARRRQFSRGILGPDDESAIWDDTQSAQIPFQYRCPFSC